MGISWEEVKELKAENEKMRAALKAVDALWLMDNGEFTLNYEQEVAIGMPVGVVWKQIRDALGVNEQTSVNKEPLA